MSDDDDDFWLFPNLNQGHHSDWVELKGESFVWLLFVKSFFFVRFGLDGRRFPFFFSFFVRRRSMLMMMIEEVLNAAAKLQVFCPGQTFGLDIGSGWIGRFGRLQASKERLIFDDFSTFSVQPYAYVQQVNFSTLDVKRRTLKSHLFLVPSSDHLFQLF